MSSTFQVWNPSANNQLSDSDYTDSSQRQNGASNPSLFPSNLANKLFYQLSTFVSAFAAAMASKGYNMADSNFATLQSILVQLMTEVDFSPIVVTGATPTCDCSRSVLPTFQQTLSANSSPTVTNVTVPGQRVLFIFQQDATGGHTVTWPANVKGAGPVDPGASTVSVQEFINISGALYPTGPMVSV